MSSVDYIGSLITKFSIYFYLVQQDTGRSKVLWLINSFLVPRLRISDRDRLRSVWKLKCFLFTTICFWAADVNTCKLPSLLNDIRELKCITLHTEAHIWELLQRSGWKLLRVWCCTVIRSICASGSERRANDGLSDWATVCTDSELRGFFK